MKTLNELQLTDLEKQFITVLIDNLYAEQNFTDVTIKQMSDDMGIDVKSAKGVFGSLVKKGICNSEVTETSEYVTKGRKMALATVKTEFVILHSDYFYLHPNWNQ